MRPGWSAADAAGVGMTDTAVPMPAGIATFLYSELMGLDGLTDETEGRRRAHFRLVREAADERGRAVRALGEGLLVVFESAVDAVGCAVEIQQATTRHNLTSGSPLESRIALHVGEPIRDEGDFFGPAVSATRRTSERAGAGQVVATELVRGLVGSRGAYRFETIDSLTLPGLAQPLAVCAVTWAPPPPPPRPSVLLPPALGEDLGARFVGRVEELEKLSAAWQDTVAGSRRLVLVAGEPGIGKTSLAAVQARMAAADGALVLHGRCDEDLG